MSINRDEHQALLQDSVQTNLPSENQPKQDSQDLFDLKNQRYVLIGGLVVLLIIIAILCYAIFRANANTIVPTYVLYNATIYASSFHGASDELRKMGPDFVGVSEEGDAMRAGKSGLNPFEYNTAMVLGSDGRFYDLGYDDSILAHPDYSDLPRVDMNKAVISPGFADAHGHFMSYGLGFLEPDTRTAKSPTQFVQQLLSFCQEYHIDPQASSESWLIGGRWDESQWQSDPDYDYEINPETGEHPFPTHKMLDKAFPKLGVALRRIDAHACFVNQVVLDQVNLPDVDPPGGKILRDEDGKPTGVLIDYACELIWNHKQAQPSALHYRTALTKSMQQLTSLGLTSVHDASMLNAELFASHLALPRKLIPASGPNKDTKQSLYDPFPVRVHAMIDAEALCAVHNYKCPDPFPFKPIDQSNGIKLKNGTNWVKPAKFDIDPGTNAPGFNVLPKVFGAKNGRFDTTATKMMADGALGSWGAFLSKPYTDKPTTSGIQMYTQPQLNSAVLNLANQGFQVCTHAIGDAAVQQVLDAYEHAGDQFNSTSGLSPEIRRAQFVRRRHRVEHFQIIPEHHKWSNTMEKYGILSSMQSIHAVQDRTFAETRLGKDRLESQGYLWREIETTNDLLALGTDFPVSAPSVIQNVYAAVTMMEIGVDLPPFLPDHTLHIIDALMGVTADPAYAQSREHDYGRIAKGYVADFIVLSQDWLGFAHTVSPDDRDIGKVIADTTVLATFVDGNVVFEHQNVKLNQVEDKKNKKHFAFTSSTPEDPTKKPWYAVRQPAKSPMSVSTNDPHFVSVVNSLKQETFEYISTNKARLEAFGPHVLQSSLFQPLVLNETGQYTEQDLQLWSQMRFLTPSNRIAIIETYLRSNTLVEFEHTFLTLSETPVKAIEREYGHHHHAENNSKYRANTIYKVQNSNGEDVLVQPRVPPCIEHMGTRESSERRNFAYSHIEQVGKEHYRDLGLPIIN